MMLAPGARLGPYVIEAPLGAGGMGEVYRGRDTRLERDVAIKVLPESFAVDADRVARFTREARTLASLNDPHIAAIYGVEEQDGVRALVMELVEGRDLSDVIALGPIALADALPIARQIAGALETAHEHGIIHRDLKPANIKVRPDGTVKVLDFGLAKALGPEGASATADALNSPTLTARATQMGTIIGTAAYMAPEQAKGRAVDRRADIWAFGAILFEMLTGRRAFKGDDVSDTLASVLKDEPEIDALPPATPRVIRSLIARCLQKDPRLRQRDIGDVRLELDAIVPDRIDVPATTARSRVSPLALVGGIAVVLAIGIAAGWLVRGAPAPSTVVEARFTVPPPTPGAFVWWPLVTPDGRTVLYGSNGRLYRRSLAEFEAVAIPGTEGGSVPMLSPDGASLAFFADRKIKRVSMTGGDPVAIADADNSVPGACWCTADLILFSRAWSTGLSAVPAGGGPVRQLTTPDVSKGERAHWRPQPLPGGRRVLFTIMMAATGVNDSRIAVLDLDTGTYRALFPGTDGLYLASGYVLYFHGGAWHRAPFDASAATVTGQAVTVLPDAYGVPPDGGSPGHLVSASSNGVVAYLPGPAYPRRELAWIDRTGSVQAVGLPAHAIAQASLSADGKRVALTRVEGGSFQVWVADLARKTEDRLEIKGSNFGAIWDPRGEWLAFVSERKGEYDVYIARPDGSGERALLTKDFDEAPRAWSRDGQRILVQEWRLDGTTPIVGVDSATGGSPEPLLLQATDGASTQVSPDNRWLLYASRQSRRSEVYVRALARDGAAVRVSSEGGYSPHWSPDGKEILFRSQDAMMVASFRDAGGRPDIGLARALFNLPQTTDLYGVDVDGRRFLIGRPTDPEPTPGVRVALDWFSTAAPRRQ